MSFSIVFWAALLLFTGFVLGIYMASFHTEREKKRLIAEREATIDQYKKQVKSLEKNLKEFKKLEK